MIISRHPFAARGEARSFHIDPFSPTEDRQPILAAWVRAFAEPPNGPRLEDDLAEQLERHMSCRDFAGFTARDGQSGQVLGFIYGYTNSPGEWWNDRVAQAMNAGQVKQILQHSYCLTELGVIPEARRQGIADALVDALVTAQPHPCVLLSTRSDNRAGKAFYHATGWRTLLPAMSFGWNYPPYDILLRERQ